MISTSPTLLSRLRDPEDRAAWETFDARYGDLVVRFCRGQSLQYADAEDVRQAVMIRLARALRRFRYAPARGRFRSYLGRIVRNEINRHWSRPSRRSGRVLTVAAVAQTAADDRAPEDRWEREWAHHHLRLAMQALRPAFEPRSLEVFDRLLAGATVAEVSETFGMSAQAVHKVKQRVRDRLRALVAAQIRDEDDPHGATRPSP